MIVEVEMVAFKESGHDFGIRNVEVPDHEAVRLPEEKLLEAVMRYGQNDLQPQQIPSVSVGDVVRIDGRRFLVSPVGFKELKHNEEGGWRKGYGFLDR